MQEFLQNSAFSPTSAPFVLFALGTPLLAIFSKVDEFAQNSVFSPRLARFVFFALGAERFSNFQQRAQVCTKQRFQPEISTFCHFRTGCTTFLAVFSKVQEFVHDSIFSLISARFVSFALSKPLFSNFQQSERVFPKHGS